MVTRKVTCAKPTTLARPPQRARARTSSKRCVFRIRPHAGPPQRRALPWRRAPSPPPSPWSHSWSRPNQLQRLPLRASPKKCREVPKRAVTRRVFSRGVSLKRRKRLRTRSGPLSRNHCLCCTLVEVRGSHLLARTHTHTHTHTHTQTQALSLTHTLTHTHTHVQVMTFGNALASAFTHSHTHTYTHTHTHSHSHSLTLTHTDTLTHTHTHTHTHTLAGDNLWERPGIRVSRDAARHVRLSVPGAASKSGRVSFSGKVNFCGEVNF